MADDPLPSEVLAFFKAKGLRPAFDYREVWREEHAVAFTVAKATQVDVLTAIRKEVDLALSEGRTFQQFKKDLTPKLQKLGWWGEKEILDPKTGEMVTAQLGSPRRLKTIYNTNLRTARAAGQWQRIERTKEGLPYLLYQLGPSRVHRVAHLKFNGLILRVDDPFWRTHFPPNGWGCKCWVRQLDRAEAESKGGESKSPKIETRAWTNTRTGEVMQVPVGLDPGFDVNPGLVRLTDSRKMLTGKLNRADPLVARAAVHDVVNSPLFADFIDSPQGSFPVAVLPQVALEAIGAKNQVAMLSQDTLTQHKAHPFKLGIDAYRLLPALGGVPSLIIQDGEQLVGLVYLQDEMYFALFERTADGLETYLVSLYRANAKAVERRIRRGTVILDLR